MYEMPSARRKARARIAMTDPGRTDTVSTAGRGARGPVGAPKGRHLLKNITRDRQTLVRNSDVVIQLFCSG